MDPVPFAVWSLALLTVGLRRRQSLPFVLSGVLLAGSSLMYYSGRVMLVVVALFLLYLLLVERRLLWANRRGLLWLGLGAAVAMGPMLIFFLLEPAGWLQRSREVWVFNPPVLEHSLYKYGVETVGQIMLEQARRSLLMFNLSIDSSTQFGPPAALGHRTAGHRPADRCGGGQHSDRQSALLAAAGLCAGAGHGTGGRGHRSGLGRRHQCLWAGDEPHPGSHCGGAVALRGPAQLDAVLPVRRRQRPAARTGRAAGGNAAPRRNRLHRARRRRRLDPRTRSSWTARAVSWSTRRPVCKPAQSGSCPRRASPCYPNFSSACPAASPRPTAGARARWRSLLCERRRSGYRSGHSSAGPKDAISSEEMASLGRQVHKSVNNSSVTALAGSVNRRRCGRKPGGSVIRREQVH